MAAALGRIPSGIFVLTARHGDQETGLLASWVQQCSFAPLMVTVAVRADRYVANWLLDGSSFVLNILDEAQTDMIVQFGKGFAAGEDAFDGLEVDRQESTAPILTDALAYLNCRVEGRYTPGDHVLVAGRVVGGRLLNDGQPMVHIRKNGTHY